MLREEVARAAVASIKLQGAVPEPERSHHCMTGVFLTGFCVVPCRTKLIASKQTRCAVARRLVNSTVRAIEMIPEHGE